MGDLILHNYGRSSAAFRVRIGLNLLNLPYARQNVDLLAGDQSGAQNKAANPQGLVPSLNIDGETLTQSLAILEYLNETRQAGWLPDNPIQRAKARALAYAISMDIHPICNLHVVRHAVTLGGTTTEEWMGHFISKGFVGLEAMLLQFPNGAYCLGDDITLADICLVPQVYNARRWGVDMAPFPRIAVLDATLAALPAFAAAHPDQGESRS